MEKKLNVRAVITIAVSFLCYMVTSWAFNNVSAGWATCICLFSTIICIGLATYNYLKVRDELINCIVHWVQKVKES